MPTSSASSTTTTTPATTSYYVNCQDVSKFLSSLVVVVVGESSSSTPRKTSTTTTTTTAVATTTPAATTAKWNTPPKKISVTTAKRSGDDDGGNKEAATATATATAASKKTVVVERTVQTLSGVSYTTTAGTTTSAAANESSIINERDTSTSSTSIDSDNNNSTKISTSSSNKDRRRQLDITYPTEFLETIGLFLDNIEVETAEKKKTTTTTTPTTPTDETTTAAITETTTPIIRPLPILIHVHGGGWSRGSKDQYFYGAPSICENISASIGDGVICISVGYTLGNYPTFMHDVSQAIQWVYQNVENLGGDRSRIYISGHSAGGHLVSLLMLRYHDFLQNANKGIHVPYNFFHGMILLSGVYDLFCPMEKNLLDTKNKFFLVGYVMPAFGLDNEKRRNASPLLLLDPDKDTSFLGRAAKLVQERFLSWRTNSSGSSGGGGAAAAADDAASQDEGRDGEAEGNTEVAASHTTTTSAIADNETSSSTAGTADIAATDDVPGGGGGGSTETDEIVTINKHHLPSKILILNATIDMGLQENGKLFAEALTKLSTSSEVLSDDGGNGASGKGDANPPRHVVEHYIVPGTDHASICWNNTTFAKIRELMEL